MDKGNSYTATARCVLELQTGIFIQLVQYLRVDSAYLKYSAVNIAPAVCFFISNIFLMQFLKAILRISFLFFFCWIGLFVGAQTETGLTKYENDKYRFSFSYPSQYLVELVNDDEWIIRNTDHSWAIGFKIMHLEGRNYESYVKSLSTSLFSALASGYGLSATFDGTPERNPYGRYMIGGFEFDLYIVSAMGSGTDIEKLTNSWNLYLNIFKKTSQASFVPDGIMIYDFRQPFDNDGHKLTKQVINSFEKTVVFKEAIVTKPVVTTVAKKKPVTITPVVKKPIAPKPSTFNGTSKAPAKLTSVTIGKQTWMVKNLDVATYRNGDPIPNVTDNTAWSELTTGAYCYYNNDSATYAVKYGKIYNWYAVNDPRGLAPAGWHIPSDDEWTTLINYLGGEKVAGRKMKEKGATHWSGLPGGWRSYDGTFHDVKIFSYWWSSKEINTSYAWHLGLYFNGGFPTLDDAFLIYGSYVRCLRD